MADAVVRNRGAAMIGVLGGLFATPFFFYLVSDPSYSHTFSAFLASAFIYVAMQYVPRLFAKGGVVRDLLLWRQAHTSPDVVSGLLLLLLEAACLVVVLVLARRLLLRNSPAEEAG